MRTYITPQELINQKLDIGVMSSERACTSARFEAHVAALLHTTLERYQLKQNINKIWTECIPQLQQAKRVDHHRERHCHWQLTLHFCRPFRLFVPSSEASCQRLPCQLLTPDTAQIQPLT